MWAEGCRSRCYACSLAPICTPIFDTASQSWYHTGIGYRPTNSPSGDRFASSNMDYCRGNRYRNRRGTRLSRRLSDRPKSLPSTPWPHLGRRSGETGRPYFRCAALRRWIPAFAGMTRGGFDDSITKQNALVLLRHICREGVCARRLCPQQGHRGSRLTSATARRLRRVAIELGMCRSGRIGGASGSVTVG